MGLELFRSAAVPTAAEEKDDGWALVAGLMSFGLEEVEPELGAAGLLVGLGRGAGEAESTGVLFLFFLLNQKVPK